MNDEIMQQLLGKLGQAGWITRTFVKDNPDSTQEWRVCFTPEGLKNLLEFDTLIRQIESLAGALEEREFGKLRMLAHMEYLKRNFNIPPEDQNTGGPSAPRF